MNRKTSWIVVCSLALALLLTGIVRAGGWAVLTLTEMPGVITAGDPFTVRFAVRQHGQTLVPGLTPVVTAVHPATGQSLEFLGQETSEPGFYEVTLTLPEVGDWNWEIESFGVHPLPPVTAQASAPPRLPANASLGLLALSTAAGLGTAVALIAWTRQRTYRRLGVVGGLLVLGTLSLVVWLWASSPVIAQTGPAGASSSGEALFVAKGCYTCHQNSRVTQTTSSVAIGPDLSHYSGSADFLRRWLHDPASIRPETRMPNLQLSEAEIESLIQFLKPDSASAR